MSEFEGQVVEGQPEGVEPQGQQETAPQPNPLEPGGVRFEQVYGRMKDYEQRVNQFKELGDPAAVREQLNKLATYEKALAEYRKQQSMTPQEQSEAQRAAQIRKELEKVYPEIKDMQTLKEMRDEMNRMQQSTFEAQATATLDKASQKFSEVLKTNKIDTKYQTKIEEYLVSQMSQEERQDFVRGNFEIAERIFNNELKEGLFAGMRARTLPPSPALRHTPGGTPPTSKGKGPTTLEEAASEAFGRISGN